MDSYCPNFSPVAMPTRTDGNYILRAYRGRYAIILEANKSNMLNDGFLLNICPSYTFSKISIHLLDQNFLRGIAFKNSICVSEALLLVLLPSQLHSI